MQRAIQVFVFCCVVAVGLFKETAGAGFVTDHIGWLHQYDTQGTEGILHAFDDKALHYVYHLFGFLFWKWFGFNGTYWMLLFAALHALVATLGFLFLRKLFENEKLGHPQTTAFTTTMLFLLSPYATETVVWYACIHYLICCALMLGCLYCFLQFCVSRKPVFLVIYYILFFVALFTLEISFALPFLVSAIILFSKDSTQKLSLALKTVLPLIVLLGFYFALSTVLRGSAVGHYGASTHLQFNPFLLASNLAKYTAKIFGFTQFFSFDSRDRLYALLDTKTIALLIIFSVLFKWLVAYQWRKNYSSAINLSVLLFTLFALSLLPVLNLYFTYMVSVEGDRLSYLASFFAYAVLALALTDLFGKAALPLGILFILFLQKPLLDQNIQAWAQNATVHQQLINNFPSSSADTILVLSSPDNFRGTYMLRDEPAGNILETELHLRNRISKNQRVIQVLGFNMIDSADVVNATLESGGDIKVSFGQYGNWWWMKGIGAADYENKMYSVRVGEWGEYYLRLKPNVNCDIIYSSGTSWKKLPH